MIEDHPKMQYGRIRVTGSVGCINSESNIETQPNPETAPFKIKKIHS